jgi:hypothetical protein
VAKFMLVAKLKLTVKVVGFLIILCTSGARKGGRFDLVTLWNVRSWNVVRCPVHGPAFRIQGFGSRFIQEA